MDEELHQDIEAKQRSVVRSEQDGKNDYNRCNNKNQEGEDDGIVEVQFFKLIVTESISFVARFPAVLSIG